MDPKYAAWVAANVKDPLGRCAETTLAMCTAFPELTRVRGHYLCGFWGPREHWWCTAPDGGVVDPTAAQFPSRGLGRYEPWVEGTPEPTGKCPNCGGECYDNKYCCSAECDSAYAAYCNNPGWL